MKASQERCGRWSKAKGGRWIERLGTTPASRVVRLRLRVHQQSRSREKLPHRSGEAGASHDRRRRLPRVQPIWDQRRGRHRRIPSLHSHLARVPLCGSGRLLLWRSPPAGDRRDLPGRAVRGRARLGGRDAAGRVRERRRSGRQQDPGRGQLINPQSYKWFFETTTPVEGHMHAIVRTLVEARTKFQQVEIMETASYGKCLVLDGRIQSSEADEFVYHEALVHPGLLAVDLPPTPVLVIGGGEGATLRETLKCPSVQRAVMVDIDDEVVALCRQHLPEMHRGAFDDPRTELRHEDARAYLERTDERFDLIIVDLVEP